MVELCTAPSSSHAKHSTYDCVKGGGVCRRAGVPFLHFIQNSFNLQTTLPDIPPKTKWSPTTSDFFSFLFILIFSSPFPLPFFPFSFSYFHPFLFSSSFFSSSIFPFLSLFPPFLCLFPLFFSLLSSCLFFFHHSLFSLLFPSPLSFFCFVFPS